MTASSGELGEVVGTELVEVRSRVLEPAGQRIAADDRRAERALVHAAYPRPVPEPTVANLTYEQVAKTIDHSLLRPELDLDSVRDGVELARRYGVASATVRPADVAFAVDLLEGSDVFVSTVVGFPHGSSSTETKAFEAERARRARRP